MATKQAKKSLKPLDENKIGYGKIGNRIKQIRIKAGYTSAEKFA